MESKQLSQNSPISYVDSVGTRVINSDMSCYGNNLMLTSYINVQLVYV